MHLSTSGFALRIKWICIADEVVLVQWNTQLAIARAIYSNKPIILLDEATSSLDEKTEIQLLNNLKQLKNKTLVLVTHRNTALTYCDKIVQF